MTTRREFVKGLIISVGGASALSACGDAATIIATATEEGGQFYSSDEMALVSRISDLIIPRTETPGALDANVPGYLDALMSDWASAETQNYHREALKLISGQLDARSGEFLTASEPEAIAALSELDREAFEGGNNLDGYRSFKGYITQSYFATELGATEELKWVAVPGVWDPSVKIATGN
ncbi:MAG: hypothetical protein CMD92_04625 [Gammaproteobacteria bacterium]|nr:hypothetical protein [Gammaproteobacteria bacterium]HBW84413.1 hypothetical protein [Gammaproteobacteria bacterium]|tara:strand:+ start:4219 stop:4758 length:540 start_codon:yes stop_codon:yes gene_type:complete